MVNLDQAQKNVRNAQDQLDQALKELEKAKKKPEVWEQTIHDGCLLRANRFDVSQVFDYPCKVTVRPIGGPEPVVFRSYIVQSSQSSILQARGKIVDENADLGMLIGKRVLVTVKVLD